MQSSIFIVKCKICGKEQTSTIQTKFIDNYICFECYDKKTIKCNNCRKDNASINCRKCYMEV